MQELKNIRQLKAENERLKAENIELKTRIDKLLNGDLMGCCAEPDRDYRKKVE